MAVYGHYSFPGLVMQIDPEARVVESVVTYPSSSLTRHILEVDGMWQSRFHSAQPISETALEEYFYTIDKQTALRNFISGEYTLR